MKNALALACLAMLSGIGAANLPALRSSTTSTTIERKVVSYFTEAPQVSNPQAWTQINLFVASNHTVITDLSTQELLSNRQDCTVNGFPVLTWPGDHRVLQFASGIPVPAGATFGIRVWNFQNAVNGSAYGIFAAGYSY